MDSKPLLLNSSSNYAPMMPENSTDYTPIHIPHIPILSASSDSLTSDENISSSNNEGAENLREAASKRKWSKVLKMCMKNLDLYGVQITEKGDTVLHMAVSGGSKLVVEHTVDFFSGKKIKDKDKNKELLKERNDQLKRILKVTNEKGNTPLHLAASMGNVEMCKKMGRAYASLISTRNSAGETPLFLAALHGKRKAFLLLHYHLEMNSIDLDQCIRRDNNDTILQCAMEEGHIGVTIEIFYLYHDLVEDMIKSKKNDLSPLHVLATTRSAFKSTDLHCRSFVVQLIYHWFFSVEKKEQATTKKELEQAEPKPYISAVVLALYKNTFNYHGGSFWIGKIWSTILYLLFLLVLCLLAPLLTIERLFISTGNWFHKIRELKEKHTWSLQIMEQLLELASEQEMSEIKLVSQPSSTSTQSKNDNAGPKIIETPLMIAAKNGMIEMVDKILNKFPSMMKDVNDEGKNIVLLAAEKRQTKLYQILCENDDVDKSLFRQVDKDGNTALHLAAKLGANLNTQTTTMVEEFKWFEFVKSSVPFELWEKYNNERKTAEEIFRDSYGEQMSKDREWLNQTSEACSVASTLVASMAFANVAINFDNKNYASLVALSLSLTSTISFLGILAFRSQSLRFWRWVPIMLHIAIFTMFGSIVSLWISLMLHDRSFMAYGILGSPIAILTIVLLPIFIGPTLMSMFTKVPSPSHNTTSAIRYQMPQKKENGTNFDRNQKLVAPSLTFKANDSLQDMDFPMTRLRIKRMNSL